MAYSTLYGHLDDAAAEERAKERAKASRLVINRLLAEQFCMYLGIAIPNKDDQQEALRLNAAEENKNICHLDDYCDPNQCMLDAIDDLFPLVGEWVGDLAGETAIATLEMGREAYEIAKSRNFCFGVTK